MLEKVRHKAKPYLVLSILVVFTIIAAIYVSPYSAAVGLFLSYFFFITHSLRRATKTQEELTAQLEQHRIKLKELISQVPGVLWEMHGTPERGLSLTFISEYLKPVLGYEVGESIATPKFWIDIVHPDDRERVSRELQEIFHKGAGGTRFRWLAKDGREVSVETHVGVVVDERGSAVGLRGVSMESTARHGEETEREREQLLRLEHTARKQAESANHIKDEFIATLSHELRTPLTPIMGWAQLLKERTTSPATLQRGLDVIERSARSQARLIDDLLDMSRIVTGKIQVKMQTIELQPIVRAALDAVQPAADAKGVAIEITAPSSPIQFTADPNRLQQVFWNLLSNAIKFTPSGGVVSISSEWIGTELRVVVRDNGEGIDPAFIPHVFDRFSQADSTNVRAHGGLGVGLAIVRYLVELHGGQVSAKSPGKGRGSTFTVTLPVKTYGAKAPARRSKRGRKAVSSLEGLRLLVVDDEADVRELLALVLQHEGAVVATASSAQEALRILQANPIDVLISDIAMPEENGYVLLEKWREIEREQQKPPVSAIALTAYAREDDRKYKTEPGFEVHLSKPVETEKLISSIIAAATKHLGKAG
jgi:signal transduction histidine kinase/ActR/RegA family two-component response regulator